ncbi:MAG TPA: TonB-dependent receptor [Burkholderiales bacterium]|nr:TonB-dependent receptor [Burkholderiales bacterium]
MKTTSATFLHAAASALALVPAAAHAQQQAAAPVVLPNVSVTATRVERPSFELPVSIDTVGAQTIREDRPGVNLSEALNAVPGIVVSNRQNYAQDLQISSRGFGARSTFGVRGLRLISDGIPATMPDGQGQAASFNLDTAERIEVLRGPFASMYGNASGGVIQIFTADGPRDPTFTGKYSLGSYDTSKWALGYGGTHGPLNLNAITSVFRTDGYRDHSAARRDHTHAKLKVDGGTAGTFTFVADALDQPETQDPLGLTRAQVQANRRQADPVATQFDTRKSISQTQAGLLHDIKLGSRDSLHARVYYGDRQVTQYLGIPLTTPAGAPVQLAATHSGGVVDLDRQFGGAGLRWTHMAEFAGTVLGVHVGMDYERMEERRRGFLNIFGNAGALKRNEDDTVSTTDGYVQLEWHPLERMLVLAGVRHSRVKFESEDFFVVPATANGNDSGSIRYVRTTPVAGISYEVMPRLNAYVNAGKGFETPTFAELAYRPDGTSGLNFALQPSLSTHYETGVKFKITEKSLLTAAIYRINVSNEIVVAANSGGRTTFKNAPHTRREGLEVGWQGKFGAGWEAAVAYTYLKARFRDTFTTGAPAVTVPAGNRLPGVPASTLYGELVWRYQPWGFHAGAEVRYSAKIFVDDQNSDAAESYTFANLRAGFEQKIGTWRLTEFVRVDNVTDKKYIGSVIVAEGNRRFFEPAPTRNWLVGVTAHVTF